MNIIEKNSSLEPKQNEISHRILFISFLYIISYLINVLSSTWILHEDRSLYLAKHLTVGLLAAIGILFSCIKSAMTLKPKILFNVSLFLFSTSIYLLHGTLGLILFLQVIIILVASLSISEIWQSGLIFRLRWLLTFIAALPVGLDYLIDGGKFIYSSYYGRSRLLLGYWHPKETGIAILFVIMVWRLRFPPKPRLFDLAAVVLLWYIQSRNGLLFYLNFLFISWLLRRFSIKQVGFILLVFYGIIPLMGFFLIKEELDLLASNRITFWAGAADLIASNDSPDIATVDPGSSIAHVDNFYLEYYSVAGIAGLSILIVFFIWLAIRLGKTKIGNVYKNAIFLPFLIYCFLDAGLFSTGNFLNLLVFPLILTRSPPSFDG